MTDTHKNLTDQITTRQLGTLDIVQYDANVGSELERMECLACVCEYLFDRVEHENRWPKQNPQHDRGVVANRHAVISLIPSLLAVYRELLKIKPHLPCFDFVVMPAIFRTLEPFLHVFYDWSTTGVITEQRAKEFALDVAQDGELL